MFSLVAEGPESIPVRTRCRAIGVSEQGYYAYLERKENPSARVQNDIILAEAIAKAHAVGRETYGTPRLKVELAKHEAIASRRRIGRIRDSLGLSVKQRKRFVRTTQADESLVASPNLLDRKFVAQSPNSVWVSDITYLTSGPNWLYLCTVIDCYSGAIVGRQLSRSIDTRLVRDALDMAIRTRKPEPGCIFHSDRGSQYSSHEFRADLASAGFVQSMSRRANCWDNAVAESSFSRLKHELGDTFTCDYDARAAVYEYIDVFYNFIRIHSRHNMAPFHYENDSSLSMLKNI